MRMERLEHLIATAKSRNVKPTRTVKRILSYFLKHHLEYFRKFTPYIFPRPEDIDFLSTTLKLRRHSVAKTVDKLINAEILVEVSKELPGSIFGRQFCFGLTEDLDN